MDGVPEAHDVLLRKGLLHQWTPGMSVIFVSHQWLGSVHPDPDGRHAAVLQGALQGVLNGSLQIELDVAYDTTIGFEDVVEYARQQVLAGYIFLDWFAIPQITARVEGVNEESTKSDAALAVQSIPFYVETSSIFLALVPEVKHHDTRKYCNYASWLSRGWCRAELWCHLLSNKPVTQVIVVYSTKEAQFMYPRDWQENNIVEGDFTVESDRDVVKKLGEVAVEHKIQNLSTAGPLSLYRFFLARRSRMLGQPSLTWEVDDFLHHFKFPDLESATTDKSSMNALLCATFSGDVEMVRLLAHKKADLNANLHGLEKLGFPDVWNLLIAALEINTLLDLGCDANFCTWDGSSVAGFAKSPQQVDELSRGRADLHTAGMPLGMTPLALVAGMSNLETVSALLQHRCDPDPPLCGLGVTPLMSAVLLARGNCRGVEIVRTLLEARANPNVAARPTGAMWLTEVAVARAKVGWVALLGRETCARKTRSFATLPGSTVLSTAAGIGSEELVELLLSYGAYPQPNDRGETCEFLAEADGHYNVLPCFRTFAA
ncbi:unnamed protein product [Durusdinium trenchii]|uniref:Uncharacterized protein n=1 Tax=Durusdinium trenchii TaxID=1381693 RepID=A0ABP0JMQ2_9DINO